MYCNPTGKSRRISLARNGRRDSRRSCFAAWRSSGASGLGGLLLRVALFALIAGGMFPAFGEGIGDIVRPGAPALGVRMSLFGADRTRPAARLEIDRLSVGAQRHGIFRIGILRALIAQGIRIEFITSPADPSALASLAPALKLLAKDAASELHNVSIVIGSKTTLTAEGGSAGSGDTMYLTHVAIAGGDRPESAMLVTAGGKAGEISYELNGSRRETNIFKPASPNQNPTL